MSVGNVTRLSEQVRALPSGLPSIVQSWELQKQQMHFQNTKQTEAVGLPYPEQ